MSNITHDTELHANTHEAVEKNEVNVLIVISRQQLLGLVNSADIWWLL